MIAADHFEKVIELARDLSVDCSLVGEVLFIDTLGYVFALSYRHVEGTRPAFTLLRKNDPVYSALDGWLLNDEGELMGDRNTNQTLGHLVFTSIFQHALMLKKGVEREG